MQSVFKSKTFPQPSVWLQEGLRSPSSAVHSLPASIQEVLTPPLGTLDGRAGLVVGDCIFTHTEGSGSEEDAGGNILTYLRQKESKEMHTQAGVL